MNKKLQFLVLGVVLILAILFFSVKWAFRPASKSVEKEKADFTMEASALAGEFEIDEQKANVMYLDKVIQVKGIIDNISDEKTVISVTLKDPESLSGVICSFDKSSLTITQLTPGEKITVKGICTGYLLDVVLSKCALVE
ncbi:MAG: hypothetical protein JXJ22_14945 [Bacteroidales bacterium]|nr:hypothetical protein [Bacteroidales bacterium]